MKKTNDHPWRLGPCRYKKMPEASMHTTALLNTLWEVTRGVEDNKESFIQKALKVCKVFKVKSLKALKLNVPAKKTAYNLFCKDIRETKEELNGVTVSKASAIISKESKKVKASDKKMKKYRDLYEVEEQRHEEALQRYQEDHMDEVEIINLQKRCNKTGAKAETKRVEKQMQVQGQVQRQSQRLLGADFTFF